MIEHTSESGSVAERPGLAGVVPDAPPAPEWSFARLIGTATGVKLVMDTSVQLFNPFLSIFAAGLGASVVAMGRLISLRSLMGLFAPGFGMLADRWGYRRTIRLSLTLASAGILLIGFSPSFWVAVLGIVIMGLGTGSFVPMLQAYLSGRLPYAQRARGLGIVEYSWALTGIVGLSLMGALIAWQGWRAPMILLGVLLLAAGWVVQRMPPTYHAAQVEASPGSHAGVTPAPRIGARVRGYFALPHNVRSTYSTISAGALNYFAAMQLMIIYGAWLAAEFGLTAQALGTVAFALGVGDLLASVAVSLFTDRFGKRRSVILGTAVALVGYVLLPQLDTGVLTAVLGIAIARTGFEFAIVSYFPLLSEQVPEQRSKVMSLGSAISLTVATASGFTAPWLLTTVGISGVTMLSAAAASVALLILLSLVRDRASH